MSLNSMDRQFETGFVFGITRFRLIRVSATTPAARRAAPPLEWVEVKPAPTSAESTHAQPASLRRNFAWTFGGNALYGACQWAVLSLIAKLGTSEMLGQYALAVAVTAPVSMLSQMNLRSVLTTDVERRHGFGDYIVVRLVTTILAVAAIALIALLSRYPYATAASIGLVGLSMGVDNISDIYYGPLQRSERMEQIARSMIARGVLALCAFGAALLVTRNLVTAVATLALARLAVLLIYDRPRGSQGQILSRSGRAAQWAIFRTALPLGVALMLVSLTSNIPRYAVDRFLGTGDLGVFAAVAAFLTAGSTFVNALGQSAIPTLARCFSTRDLAQFRRLTWRLTVLAVLLGLAGVLLSALFGGFVLRLAYRAEYAGHAGLLVTIMGAATCVYVAVVLGYIITSARSFLVQIPLLTAVTATSAAASWWLVPAMGLRGAALAVAFAACVQIAGEVLILKGALRRAEIAP